MAKFFDLLNDITDKKQGHFDDESIKEYKPFLVNRFLSFDMSCVHPANEMNIRSSLDKDIQYNYLLNAVRKKKRFLKYQKKDSINNLETIQEYFGYSIKKAKEVVDLFSKEQINQMEKSLEKGGPSKRIKK